MAEQGYVLDIDAKFIERLEKADEALDKFVKSTDKLSRQFDELASGGLSRFASAIDSIVQSIGQVSRQDIGDMGISNVSNIAAAAVDDINNISSAIQNVQEVSKRTTLSFDIRDYVKPSEVNAKIEKTEKAIADATEKLTYWQNKLSTYQEFDPTMQKADTKKAVRKIAEWESQVKSLNETYKRLNDDLEVARARAQELANAANSTEFKDIATWKAIKEAQQELLDTGGYTSRAEQQPVVDKFAQAQEQIKEQMVSTKKFAEETDDERYQMELRRLARRQKAQDDAAKADQERLEENARVQNEIEESRYRQSLKRLDNESKTMEAEQKAKEETRRKIAEADTENILKARKERQEALEAETKAQQEAIKNAQEAYTQIVNEIQAEYKKVLAELNQVADQKYKLDLFKAKHGETDETKKADDEILRRQTELNTKRENLETNYQKHLTSVVEDNEKNRAKIIIDNIERQTRIAMANQRRIDNEKEKKDKADAKRTHEERTTFSGAMGYSATTKSINDQIQAIKYLEEARDKLDKTTLGAKEYKRQVKEINNEIKRQKKEVDELTDKQRGLNEVTGRLKGMLGTIFSIHAIRGYINQISQVRGEFELQQRSLQALLQSKGEANKLWNQTVQLAVKSPFQVKELVTYTKQLAAYRVETEKLHDTTKMLADISAGLGVDMGRLILAFGQVKAANFLRGTELRQFSEAGINILDELARYYTALEGKAVTVGQVFERVSKRMVSFADVEKVLQKVTSAGGMFYQMQEVQAETLRGSMSNLQDQLDLMLNDIGEKNEGIMKFSVNSVSWLIKNYRALVPVLSIVSVGLAGMYLSVQRVQLGINAVKTGLKGFAASFLNPITIAIGVVAELTSMIIRHRQGVKQVEESYKRFVKSMDEIDLSMNDALNTSKIDEARVALSRLLDVARNDFSIDFGIDSDKLQNMDLTQVKEKFIELRDTLFDAEAIAAKVKEALTKDEIWDATWVRILKMLTGGWMYGERGGESLQTDVRQFESSVSKVLTDLRAESLRIANELNLDRTHMLRMQKAPLETELQYVERLIKAYESLRVEIEEKGLDTSEIDKSIKKFRKNYEEAYEELDLFLVKHSARLSQLSEQGKMAFINSIVSDEGWSESVKELLYRMYNLDLEAFIPHAAGTNLDELEESLNNSLQKTDTRWQDLLRTVKEVNGAYKELNKTFDDTTAKQGAVEKYTEALDDVLSKIVIDGKKLDASSFMEMFDLTTEEGMLKALDMIAKEAPEAADKLKAKLEKGEITWEGKIKVKEDEDKKLTNLVEDLFSGYELSIELDKLNIPADFAQDFFNVEVTSLESLRSRLESMKGLFVGQNMTDKYEKYVKKLNEMERKAQEERLKTYLQYARDAVGERAKIKLEELRKLQEIEETFRKEHEPEKQAAIKKVREDSYQATQKLEWEEFQKSDTFIGLFEDLDSASSALTEHMIKKLEDFKDEWKNMPLEDMRSIVDKIGQLRTHLVEQDAFKWGKDLRDKVKKDGRSASEIQEENIAEEERISEYDREIELLQTILRLKEEGKAVQALAYAGSQDAADMSALNVKELKKEIEEREKARKKSKETVDNNKQALKDQQDLRKAYAAQAQYIQESQKMANDLYDAFSDIMDVLGQGDGMGAMFAQMGMDMANSVLNCIALQLQLKSATGDAHTFGEAMNTAMGVIGWIVMGVQLIGTALKAAFDAHDMRIDKQIQQLAENVEYLQGRFEEFEKALDKAFSTTQVESFTKALSDNIDRQIANYERMRKLEEDKKKTDQSKIDEYNDAIKDLSEQRKEIFEEQQSNVTAGILDDALSAAEGFVDAWYEAFKETGDGLSGLRDNFKEMLTDLIKKQAAMQIVGHYTKMYSDWLAGYIDVAGGDAMLTADEAKEWAAKVKETMPELNAMLENFFSSTQELLQEEGSLSELSKGIQGVTESTAQVLEALLNSMRFYVADSNTQLKNIANAFASNDVERNPLLNELRQQTALIRSIESMFDSVIGRGSGPHSGSYIKVLM